jgi:hypothetical protein
MAILKSNLRAVSRIVCKAIHDAHGEPADLSRADRGTMASDGVLQPLIFASKPSSLKTEF